MKNTTPCLVLFLLLPLFSTGQQINVKGIITIHNSKYNTGTMKPVQNAQIIADFSSPCTSDSEGNFDLIFVNIARGTSVDVKVEKAAWEVVNKRDLQDVVVGRRTPLKIFLARKGVLAQAQAELYNVSLKALTKRHDKLIQELQEEGAVSQQAIKELEQKLNTTIANRFEAEQLLNEQLGATQRRLPKFAKELAATNLDFASEMYRQAYEYFKVGKIEKAIETLDEAVLDKQAAEAVNSLDSLKIDLNHLDNAKIIERQSLDNHIASILLKAKSHTRQLEYRDATVNYLKAISILEEAIDTNQLRFAQIYWELSDVYQQINQPEKVLEYRLKRLEIIEKQPDQSNANLANNYEDISRIYIKEKKLEAGIIYLEKALEILQISLIEYPAEMANIKAKLVSLLGEHGQYLQQEDQIHLALPVYERLYKLQPKDKTIKRTIKQLRKKIKKT